MRDFPKLMGMGDVMAHLNVSRQYVDYLVESGKLRCQKISTGKVFLENEVIAFQKARQKKGRIRSKRAMA